MAESEVNEILVERMLMKFEDIPNRDKLRVNVFLIEIENVGGWILKFRKSGVIVNNRELIISVTCDATISFKTMNSFIRIMDGSSTINDEIGKGKMSMTGGTEALESFHSKWLRICDMPNTVNADIPIRPNRLPSTDKVQPLKAGWLLKKRDIFSGWRCRYFVVYPDRLEYFIDQFDSTPKATMSLLDVEVQPVKRVNMPGVGEHWGITVTTKNPKSTFRLASELTGMEGMVECTTWEKVFNVARHSCEQYLDSIVSDSEQSKLKHQRQADEAKATLEALKTKTPKSPTKGGKEEVGATYFEQAYEYVCSKQGAPRVLLFLGLAVLLVRIVWNVTKIRQMLRNIVFHSAVAVLLLVALFFLKSVFSEYFGTDEAAPVVDTTASYSTIVPAPTHKNKPLTSIQVQQAQAAAAAEMKRKSTNGKTSTNNSTVSSPVGARKGALNSDSGAVNNTPSYGGISPLPPHIITTRDRKDES